MPLDLENKLNTYVVLQRDVPGVGGMRTEVTISQEQIFPVSRSFELEYFSDMTASELSKTTVSYRSVGAEAYQGRIAARVSSVDSPVIERDWYVSARSAFTKLVPQIIAEHEAGSRP